MNLQDYKIHSSPILDYEGKIQATASVYLDLIMFQIESSWSNNFFSYMSVSLSVTIFVFLRNGSR